MEGQTGKQKGRESTKASAETTEASFVQIRERERTNLRRKITVTLNKLKDCMGRNSSKSFIRKQSRELEEMSRACREVNDDLCDHYYEDTQAVEQQELQLEYSEKLEEMLEESARHLALREDEATTVISERKDRSQAEGAKVKEVLEYAKEQTRALDEALTHATGKTAAEWARADNPEPRANLKKTRTSWQIDPTLSDEEDDLDLLDDWIDRYAAGLEEPRPQSGGKGVTQVELPKYNGSPLTWFRWIGEFKCLIHDTALGPEQKLTALSNHLNQEDKRLLTDIGGGRQSYKYALRTLKKVCGRRDLMRIADKKEIG